MKTKTFIATLTAIVVVSGMLAGDLEAAVGLRKIDGVPGNAYMYRDTLRNADGRGNMNAPMFMIFPDAPLDEAAAGALIEELGIDKLVAKYAGSAGVINPAGATYDNARDLETYKAFINRMRVISNLKIIGLGRGATFVNNVISRNAAEVAGIFTYGGTMTVKTPGEIPVPAYIGGADRSLAGYYARANAAVETGRDDTHIYYANGDEPLQQVVLSLNKKATPAEALADAWATLLSKNYRFSNYRHTSYTGAEFGQYGNYELEPYLMPDELGMMRKTVRKNLSERRLPGNGEYFWYEFVPKGAVDAPVGSVPLVVLLHGNTNDNRTQSETSGFIEVAAEENFIVAEVEWQGAGPFPSDVFLGADGIESVVYEVMATYPQIDPSRVYVQGLSAGAMMSAALGVKKSHLFAAVAGHSGGLFDRPAFGSSYRSLMDEAAQKTGLVQTPYFLISGTADEVVVFPNAENYRDNSFFNALRVYARLNDIALPEVDFAAEPILGMRMHERESVRTNKHLTLEIGRLYNEGVPLIQFTAIVDYGHWNYRPAARMMWDFFKQFSRDPETKRLICRQNM